MRKLIAVRIFGVVSWRVVQVVMGIDRVCRFAMWIDSCVMNFSRWNCRRYELWWRELVQKTKEVHRPCCSLYMVLSWPLRIASTSGCNLTWALHWCAAGIHIAWTAKLPASAFSWTGYEGMWNSNCEPTGADFLEYILWISLDLWIVYGLVWDRILSTFASFKFSLYSWKQLFISNIIVLNVSCTKLWEQLPTWIATFLWPWLSFTTLTATLNTTIWTSAPWNFIP